MTTVARQARLAIALVSVLVATSGLVAARHFSGTTGDGHPASAHGIHADLASDGPTIRRPPRLPRSKPQHWDNA